MTDSPKIYISCTEADRAEAISLHIALAKHGGFASSVCVFDDTRTYLYNMPDDSLPGESLNLIQQKKQSIIDETKKASDVFLIVLSQKSIDQEKSRTYINQECEFALKLKDRREPNTFLMTDVIVIGNSTIINKQSRKMVWK
jgi:hypothetical protein